MELSNIIVGSRLVGDGRAVVIPPQPERPFLANGAQDGGFVDPSGKNHGTCIGYGIIVVGHGLVLGMNAQQEEMFCTLAIACAEQALQIAEFKVTNQRLETSIKDLLEADQQRKTEIAELRNDLKNLKARLRVFGSL